MTSYSNIWASTTDTTKPDPWNYAAIKAAAEKMALISFCRESLYVRDLEALQGMPIERNPTKWASLFDLPVRVSKSLPETVKDKDGNEVELLGILASEPIDLLKMGVDQAAQRIIYLTGKIVRRAREP